HAARLLMRYVSYWRLAPVLLVFFAIAVGEYAYFPWRQYRTQMRMAQQSAERLSELAAYDLSSALDFRDRAGVEEAMRGLARDAHVQLAIVFDQDGKRYAALSRDQLNDVQLGNRTVRATTTDVYSDHLRVTTPVPSRTEAGTKSAVLVAEFSIANILREHD